MKPPSRPFLVFPKIIYFMAFLFFLTPGTAQDSAALLRIVHLSDTHICNLKGYDSTFVASRAHYGDGAAPLQHFLATQPQQMDADAVFITGDLVDYFEAETQKGPWLATQIEQFVPVLSFSRVPVYLTLGNHDIASYWTEAETKESFQIHAQEARAAWIRNAPCFQQGTYYRRDFTVGSTTYCFLFLDNGYSLNKGAYLDKPQLDWLNVQVQSAENPVVLFMHKYLPFGDANGDSLAFDLDSPLQLTAETCSKGLLKTLNESKNIRAIFVGHGHRNVSELMTFPSGNKILQTETAAFAQDANNWRRIDFLPSKILIYKTGEQGVEMELALKSTSPED